MLGILRASETGEVLLTRFVDFQFPEKLITEMPETYHSICRILHDANVQQPAVQFLQGMYIVNAAGLQLLRMQLSKAAPEVLMGLVEKTINALALRFFSECYVGVELPFALTSKVIDEVSLVADGYAAFEVTFTSTDDGPTRTIPLVFVYDKRSVHEEGKGWDIVCDSRNNTEETIAKHELHAELVVHDPELANAFRQRQYHWQLDPYQPQQATSGDAGPVQSSDD